MSLPLIIYYERGMTRLEYRLEPTDGVFYLKVNDGERTPISVREMQDLLYDWWKIFAEAGFTPRPLR